MKYFLQYVCSFLLFFVSVFAQNRNSEPIELKKADSLVGNKTITGNVRSFMGHVVFIQGKIHCTSDEAVQYLDENRAELIGHVVVTQDDMILKTSKGDWNGNTGIINGYEGIEISEGSQFLKAQKGIYNTRTYIADFQNEVEAWDDTVKITCDTIQYNRITRRSYAWGNVKVEDDSTLMYADFGDFNRLTKESYAYGNVCAIGKFNRSYLSSDTLLNIPERAYSLAKGNPVLNQLDSVKKSKKVYEMNDKHIIIERDSSWFEFDTLSVKSKSMEQTKGREESFFFKDSVQIARKSLAALANEAKFYKLRDLIELKGKPVVWYDSTQLHADSIFIKMKDKKLEEIHAFGNSLAASREDTLDINRINQITGDEIIIRFAQDTVRAIFSNGNAKSLYFMQNAQGEDGIGRNSSDSIFIEFKDGETENIHWLGGIQGEFYPEIIVKTVTDYYLPNFRWLDNRPRFILNNFFKKESIQSNKNQESEESEE